MRRPDLLALGRVSVQSKGESKGREPMRLCWYSNSPQAPTGYGSQTAQMLDHLVADGHEVAVLANFGHRASVMPWETDTGTAYIWPEGKGPYGLDVVDDEARFHFQSERGLVLTLYDTWAFIRKNRRLPWADQLVASWTPIDHHPVPPEVVQWAKAHRTIAMSRFGQRALADAGIRSSYIPHGISRAFRPVEGGRDARIPDDAFMVLVVAANKGRLVARKSFPELLTAFAGFARDHGDAFLYLHTDTRAADGYPIGWAIEHLGIPPSRVVVTPTTPYRVGMITEDGMARLYSGADVLLAPSMGEGFGLPVAEAMACGTPAIVTDFSAQPEIVGDSGWKVACQRWLDPERKSEMALPLITSIRDALEEAYEERGTDRAAARSIAAQAHVRAEYDADTVYAERWRPLLAELEAELAPKRERQGMTNAARRRRSRCNSATAVAGSR